MTVANLRPMTALREEGAIFASFLGLYCFAFRKSLEIQKRSITTEKPYRTVNIKLPPEGLTIFYAEFCLYLPSNANRKQTFYIQYN